MKYESERLSSDDIVSLYNEGVTPYGLIRRAKAQNDFKTTNEARKWVHSVLYEEITGKSCPEPRETE